MSTLGTDDMDRRGRPEDADDSGEVAALDPLLRDLARTPERRPQAVGVSLEPGTMVGPYRIISALGAGGMGEVYRAHDPRLGREVAVKVLRGAAFADAEDLRRFQQEALAAGALDHPNLLAVHDFGTSGDMPYLVFELLEGETLRQRLKTTGLTGRKGIEVAVQIARGLAAAHDKGIVHRDLKPENVFLTRDGRVKILDFGLAKLMRPQEGGALEGGARPATKTGLVLGTVGYMSPEQVRGLPADHRADIFAFGAILYEMVTGKRAFQGDSAVETMNAILKEEPEPLSISAHSLPVGIDRIINHCLEKSPEERFQSARDLMFDLEVLLESSGVSLPALTATPRRSGRRLWLGFVALSLLAASVVTAFSLGRRTAAVAAIQEAEQPSFRRVTFRRGPIGAARFATDGHTIVYNAAWGGKPSEVFSTRVESPGERSLGLTRAGIQAISPSGEMAVLVHRESPGGKSTHVLARMPLAGGAPRELAEDVAAADWIPGTDTLAAIRVVGGRSRLEFPLGTVVFEPSGYVSDLRVSPSGQEVAFFDHPIVGDDRGSVAVCDRAGNKRTLTREFASQRGLAWSPSGEEIWFTAAPEGTARALHAVSLSGRLRVIARMPVVLNLQDISRDGQVLVSTDSMRLGIMALPRGETKERDLSWLDYSRLIDLSDDGKTILFDETGAGGGPGYSVYLRATDGSPAIRLGDGTAGALSPDKKWVVSMPPRAPRQLVLLPTGPGQPRTLTNDPIDREWVRWLPDGKRLFFLGREPGRKLRGYLQDLEGGAPRPVTPEGVSSPGAATPDGGWVLGRDESGKHWLYPLGEGRPRQLTEFGPEEEPLRFSGDGRHVYFVRRQQDLSAGVRVHRLELATGRKEIFRTILPADPAGIEGVRRGLITPDGKSYAYGYLQVVSELYVVEGWK